MVRLGPQVGVEVRERMTSRFLLLSEWKIQEGCFMEGREKMVGSCGMCSFKMFGTVQEDIGYVLRKVWIGDPDLCHFIGGC